jgi:hypothetical protein
VKRFFLEGVMDGSLVRWFVLRPADSTLQWFDEKLTQEMFRSNVATGMYSYLKVDEANVPLPSVPAEPPTYRATLEGGAVVVGYLVKDRTISPLTAGRVAKSGQYKTDLPGGKRLALPERLLHLVEGILARQLHVR